MLIAPSLAQILTHVLSWPCCDHHSTRLCHYRSMPATHSNRVVYDSDIDAEGAEDDPRAARLAKRRRVGPGPDLDEQNIVKEPRSRKKTAARKTLGLFAFLLYLHIQC